MNNSKEVKKCDCCGYESIEIKPYDGRPQSHQKYFNLCELCANTDASSYVITPTVDFVKIELKKMQSTICYIGNLILEEIKKLNNR